MSAKFFPVLIAIVGLSACTRSQTDPNSTSVRIQTPTHSQLHSKASAQSTSLPSDFKVCFGVQVKASDIPGTQSNSCAPTVGITAGFVEAGATLEVSVPRGSDRTFELIAYLTQPGEACPGFDAAAVAPIESQLKTFKVGQSPPVSITGDNEKVTIDLVFPGLQSSLGTQAPSVCLPTPTLKGQMTGSGIVLNSAGNVDSTLSSAINEGLYITGLGGNRGTGVITTSSVLNVGAPNSVVLPPHLHSFTRKPDLGLYFAIDDEGQIYQISIDASNTATATALTASTCPFKTTDCKVPPWMQSISAGLGDMLFGLDHSGQIYSLRDTGPTLLPTYVESLITQVAFY